MKRKAIKRNRRFDALSGWLFVSPMIVGSILFIAFPLVFAIVISFFDYKLFSTTPSTFVGFANYAKAFQENKFTQGLLNIAFCCLGIPIGLVIALVLTSLLVNNKKGSLLFRTIYYIPTICGSVAITFIWTSMYEPMYGLLNTILNSIGIPKITWLGRDNFLVSMIIMSTWSGLGSSVLLLFAAMKGISKQLYEAASIDGANFFQKFRYITLPSVSSTTFYILITGIAATLQEFTRFEVMGGGVLVDWKASPAWVIYNLTTSAGGYDMGYASAMGVILGLIILALSLLQFLVSRFWVHYDS